MTKLGLYLLNNLENECAFIHLGVIGHESGMCSHRTLAWRLQYIFGGGTHCSHSPTMLDGESQKADHLPQEIKDLNLLFLLQYLRDLGYFS